MKLLLTADQIRDDRPGWLARRRHDDDGGARLGGSDVAALMGLPGSYGSPYALWMEKTGRWADGEDEPGDAASRYAMAFGLYCEDWSRWMITEEHPDLHIGDGGLYAHDEHPWMAATFDLLGHPSGGQVCQGCARRPPVFPVQQKNSAFNDWEAEGIPLPYRVQCIWEAAVMGAPMAYLVPFDRVSVRITMFEIPMDDKACADLALMMEAAEAFRDLVKTDTPPPVDAHPATGLALRKRYQLVDPESVAVVPWRLAARWRRAGQAEKRAENRKRGLLHQLLERAEGAATWMARQPGSGELVKVATRSAGPRAAHWVKASERVDTVRPSQKFNP